MNNTIKLAATTATLNLRYEDLPLTVTARREGKRLEIVIEDPDDNRLPEAERPFLAMNGRTRAGIIRFTYTPGVRVTEFADIVHKNEFLEILAGTKQFALWFTVHALPVINNATK